MAYNPQDWYWIVATNPTQVWAGARGIYVATSDSDYITWDAIAGNDATPIATEAQLWDVISQAALTFYLGGSGYGSETLDGSTDHTLTNPLKTVYIYEPDAPGRALIFPKMNLPNSRPIGVPLFVFNFSSANTFTIFNSLSGSWAIAKNSLNTFINGTDGFATQNGVLTTSRAAIFSGTAAPLNIDTDGALAANSDTLIATQKAVKTYADLRALSSRQIIAGTGLTGGGNLTTDRTISLTSPVAANLGGTGIVNNVASTTTIIGSFGITYTISGATTLTLPTSGTVLTNSRQVISGGGLTGGGDLSADRTLAVGAGTGITVNADDVALNISGLTADATPDSAADYVATYDASATTHKKVLLSNLPSSGALASEAFVTIGNTAGLSAERSLAVTAPVTLTDGGANSTATIAVSAATTSASGVSELSTDAETVTGTDTVRTTTPSNLVAKMAAPGAIGGTTPAAGTFTALTANGNTILGDASGDTLVINAKSITKPNTPAFLAYNSVDDVDVTGDGTAVTVDFDTEITDRGGDFSADTFTAPVTGIYRFMGSIFLLNLTAGTHVAQVELVTSNRTYFVALMVVPTSVSSMAFPFAIEAADMDAADTAFVRLTVLSGTKIVDVDGAASPTTFFSGALTG